jgi:hypothetical protein
MTQPSRDPIVVADDAVGRIEQPPEAQRRIGRSARTGDEYKRWQLLMHLEIVEGLLRANDERFAVNRRIRDAQDLDDALAQLAAPPLSFSEAQAMYILAMPGRPRTRAERHVLRLGDGRAVT